jgi:hypothetical protein
MGEWRRHQRSGDTFGLRRRRAMDASTHAGRTLRRWLGLTAVTAMVLAVTPAGLAAGEEHSPETPDTSRICQAPYESDFADVDARNVHYEYILCAADHGVTVGYPEGTFRPGKTIRRDQMASFIARWVEEGTGEDLDTSDVGFEDVPEGSVHEAEIHKLANAEIVLGEMPTRYNPGASVTRQQMTAFIHRALSYIDDGDAQNLSSPPMTDVDHFPDVDVDSDFFDNINALAEVGIVAGYTGGRFGPGDDVRRDQMASFVMRTPLEADPEDGSYRGLAFRQSRGDNTFAMRTHDGQLIRFATDDKDGATGDDLFVVDGQEADRPHFEIELQFQIANHADHTVEVLLNGTNPSGDNVFSLETADLDGQYTEYDFRDISRTGVALTSAVGDDSCERVVMPFEVEFYDVRTTTLWVDTNGHIGIGADQDADCGDWTNEDLPSDDLGRHLAPLWDDWVEDDDGDIFVQALGSAGGRVFIVQYDDVRGYPDSPARVTFQVQIHEATDDLEVHYEDVDSGDYRAFGRDATIGVQQSGGGPVTRYSYNQEAIFDGEALRFNTTN